MNDAGSFDAVLAAFLDARDQGEAADPHDWLTKHPEHADVLSTYLEAEGWLDSAAAPIRDTRSTPGVERPIAPPTIEGYTIGREIARGGMGVVFEAKQHEPRRTVAIKTLRDAVFATEDDVRRFRREAQAAAELSHPGIVQILALGEVDGRVWFSMPLATGGSLAEHLPEIGGDQNKAARLVRGVARAVAHGHAHGILHRDLKPSNVLLDPHGRPLVADFGLARHLDGRDECLTQTGTVLGTPAYMAPEQARGDVRAIDERTDIWSLGAILYHLLAGRPPFVGTGPGDTIDQVLNRAPPPLSKTAPQTPQALALICETCLRKDPGDRYASMRDLADDLDRQIKGQPVRVKRASRLERVRLWVKQRPAPAALALVSLVAVAAILAALTFSERSDAAQRRRRASELHAAAGRLSSQGDVVAAALTFAASDAVLPSWSARRGLAAHALPFPDRLEATESGTLWRVRYSPDGDLLAAGGADGRVYLWDDEHLVGTLGHAGQAVRGLAFNRDGQHLATGAEDGTLRVWRIEAMAEVARVALEGAAKGRPILALVWLNEDTLAVGGFDGEVHLWTYATGQLRRLANAKTGMQVASLAASPDGRTLLLGQGYEASGTAVRALRLDVETGAFLGKGQAHTSAVWDSAWDPKGRLLATADDRSASLWLADTFQPLHRFPHEQAVGAVAFSRDGSRLITATTKGHIRAFDTLTGAEIGPRRLSAGAIYGLAVDPRSGAIASVGIDSLLRVWPTPTGTPRRFAGREAFVSGAEAASLPGGRQVLIHAHEGHFGGEFVVWSREGAPVSEPVRLIGPDGSTQRCYAMRAHEDRWLLLAGASKGDDRHVQLVEVRLRGRALVLERGPLAKAGRPIGGVYLAPREGLALLDVPGRLEVFRFGADLELRPGRVIKNAANSSYSPSGAWLLRRHKEASRRFTVERTVDGSSAVTFEVEEDVGRFAISDDGRWAALSLRSDQHLQIYDVRRGRVQAVVSQTRASLMRFAAKGRILLAAGQDGRIRVWETATGEPLGRALDLRPTSQSRVPLHFSLDPKQTVALVVDPSGTVVTWDVAWMTVEDTPAGWARRRRRAELSAVRRILPDGSTEPLELATWRLWREAFGN